MCISHFEGEQAVRVVCHSQGNRVHSIGLLLGQRTLNQVDLEAGKDTWAFFDRPGCINTRMPKTCISLRLKAHNLNDNFIYACFPKALKPNAELPINRRYAVKRNTIFLLPSLCFRHFFIMDCNGQLIIYFMPNCWEIHSLALQLWS